MHAEHARYMIPLQQARRADGRGAARRLLGWLKDQEDVPLRPDLARCQAARQPEHHGHMAVVPAGVHPARML